MVTQAPSLIRSLIPRLRLLNPLLRRSHIVRHCTTVPDDYVDCWNCQEKHTHELFCPSCNRIQCTNCTTRKLNYFEILQNEVSFEVTLQTLKKYYLQIQSMLHPDRFAKSSQMEQDYSTTQSSLLNIAYKTLSDPLERGLYLLKLQGIDVDSEKVESSDPKLLNEIFTLNIQVEESEDADELKELQQKVIETIEDDKKEISEAFKKKDFNGAHEALVRMKYRVNIKKNIENKIFQMYLQKF